MQNPSTLCRAERRHWFAALQPGHWLLLIFLVGGLLQIVGWSFFARVYDLTLCSSGREETVWAWLVCNIFSSPVLVVLLVAAALFSRGGWAWKTLFGARVFGEAVMTLAAIMALRVWDNPDYHGPTGILVNLALPFPPLFSLAVLLLLAVAVTTDLYHRTRRGWLHWLGVCCLAVGNPIAIGYWYQWVLGGTFGRICGK